MNSDTRKSLLEVVGILAFVASLCVGGWFLYSVMDENPDRDRARDGYAEVAEHPDVAAHRQVDHTMTNHAPRDHTVIARFERLRVLAKEFAHQIIDECPDTRERSLALTNAEQALMWAVASIARNQ